jgi:molybdopterin synthase sulfur carrier subunit
MRIASGVKMRQSRHEFPHSSAVVDRNEPIRMAGHKYDTPAHLVPITVKYFASLREHHGADRELAAPEKGVTVAEVWTLATDGVALPDNVLMAVNLEYVGADHPVEDGDEIAFFPPVTGG